MAGTGQRNGHRKLSDYCSIFAEKTNRIGRNVESFMQSRGFFAGRRSTDESSRSSQQVPPVSRSNGDVIRLDHQRRVNRVIAEDADRYAPNHRYESSGRGQRERVAYTRNVYPRDITEASYIDQPLEPRRPKRREYGTGYEDGGGWRDATGDWTVCRPILRNGRIERPYSSTLPRRSRTINFRDQGTYYSLESRRGYPKSLQDLTDLELDDRIREATASPFLSSPAAGRGWGPEYRLEDGHRRRRYREDESLEDDYLRFCRNLSRIEKYPQGGKYEPGQVHYERECRTFGKDTVAFIYYKTCYL